MTAARLRLGSLCSGYGGLDLAVADVIDVDLAWVADCDPAAAAVLAHHHPGLPNFGDIRDIDWAAVPPVDVLTAGWPCQPVSLAGRRVGVDDERWLFHAVTHALAHLEPPPRLLVLENVPGLLSLHAGRAMGRVVRALAGLGYLGSWRIVRASDVGAPHQRRRWFCLARPAAEDTDGAAGRQRRLPAPGQATRGRARPDPGRRGRAPAAALADTGGGDPGRWGVYAPAIARWEHVTGRAAPAPVGPTRTGHRLNPAFVEWLMGLPDGWVTGVAGLGYTQQLIVLGNGVVPQQGAAALRQLLDTTGWPWFSGSGGRP